MKVTPKTFVIFILFLSLPCSAQITSVLNEIKKIQFSMRDSLEGWNTHGNLNLNANQALYEKWQSGQTNKVELTAQLQYNLTYQKKNIIWDNLLITDYGVNKLNGYEIRKTIDKVELNSIVGGKLPKNWSYSFFLNLQTQLTNTFNYDKDIDKENRIAGFLAPLYITSGPGIMYRKNSDFNFNVAPVTTKMVYVNGRVSKFDSDQQRFVSNEETELYGIKPGEKFLYKFGFYASAYYKFKLMENVVVDNRFSLYSNYLNNPKNMDLDYTMNIRMKINAFLSSKLSFQTRYDDHEYPGFQIRESLGVGFNFKL